MQVYGGFFRKRNVRMTQTRAERSDKGQVRVVERDLLVLGWITEQYAVRLDHLQILLARWSKRSSKNRLTFRAATKVVERWQEKGWVAYQNIFFGAENPPWIWLTHVGLRELGYPFKYNEPALSGLPHLHAVNTVRLALENRLRSRDFHWIGERQLRYERPGLRHYPDAEVMFGGRQIGIEVELTQKTRRRVEDIIEQLKKMEYQAVWYFVDDSTEEVVKRAIGDRRGFDIRNLKEIDPY